jgi:hypothetical protein
MPRRGASARIALDPTLAHFRRLFIELRIPWCIAGAVAANAYRSPRDTTDLDLVVQIPAERYGEVSTALGKQGWKLVRVSPDSAYPDIVRLRHDRYFPTDLLLVKTAYQAEALARSRVVRRGSARLRVLAPEDVIVHKLIAYRHRDRDDILGILRGRTRIDHPYVERWAAEWEVLDRWRETLAEAASGEEG